MKANVTLGLLLSATLILQGLILYRQNAASGAPRRPAMGAEDVPAGSTIDVHEVASKGASAATVAVVEFSDYECPYCARHATTVFPELDKLLLSNGKVRYYFINNPLPIHPNAIMLGAAAICAGDQGKYWDMHEKLFAKKPKSRQEVIELAETLNVNIDDLATCMAEQGSGVTRTLREREKAQAFGAQSTPNFAIGIITEDGKVRASKRINGAQPLSVFQGAITSVLNNGAK